LIFKIAETAEVRRRWSGHPFWSAGPPL